MLQLLYTSLKEALRSPYETLVRTAACDAAYPAAPRLSVLSTQLADAQSTRTRWSMPTNTWVTSVADARKSSTPTGAIWEFPKIGDPNIVP